MTNGGNVEVSAGDSEEVDSTRLGEPTRGIARDTKSHREKTPPHHHPLQPFLKNSDKAIYTFFIICS